jgi:hypothetical protein
VLSAPYTLANIRLHYSIGYDIQIGELRRKSETIEYLEQIFKTACQPRTKTQVGRMKTALGLKDRFLDFFIAKLWSSDDEAHRHRIIQLEADKKVYSPVWRLRGIV